MSIMSVTRGNRNRKAAGESFATKQNTHRPSPTRADGLRARDKGFFMISQTGRQNKIGDTNHEQKRKGKGYLLLWIGG